MAATTVTGKPGWRMAWPEAKLNFKCKMGLANTAHTSAGLISAGFTLVELMVVMTIIALLIAIAVPRYFHSIDNAREATLKQDLSVMREAIDKFYGDNERYPASLQELVNKKYIRSIPTDPITDSAETWVLLAPGQGGDVSDSASLNSIYDIKSGAPGNAKDGSLYAEW